MFRCYFFIFLRDDCQWQTEGVGEKRESLAY